MLEVMARHWEELGRKREDTETRDGRCGWARVGYV